MNILGIETSTQLCSVGIAVDDSFSIGLSDPAANQFTERLYVLIQEVLKKAEIEVADLNGIAISIGPGSFTGVRVGVGSAKGLAYGLSIPIVGVTTFEIIAASISRNQFPVCAIVPFKRDQVTYTICETPEIWESIREGTAGTWDDLFLLSQEICCFAGEIPDERIDTLRKIFSPPVSLEQIKLSGQTVAEIGYLKLRQGISHDPSLLKPIYAYSLQFRERQPGLNKK